MQRYILTLDNIPYLVEYRKASELSIKHVQEYVMLRKYEIENSIAIDKSIYFIPLLEFSKLISKDENTYKQNNNIVFPYRNGDYEAFSTSIFDYAPDVTLKSLIYREENDSNTADLRTDYYNLFVKDKTGAYKHYNIDCDRIRIYRPHARKHVNSIISIANYINNIHFHYFCQRYESQEIHIGKEIRMNNNEYYEYIEIYIPNTESLFGSRNVYFNEDLNFYQQAQITKMSKTFDIKYDIINKNDNKVLLRNIILPFTIDKPCNLQYDCIVCPNNLSNECKLVNIKNTYIKTFLVKDIDSIEYTNTDYNYSNIPFILTLSHYDSIDSASSHYLSLEGISPSSVVFSEDNQFFIKSTIDFDSNNRSIISVISKWNYPDILNVDGEKMELRDAYFYFNKITDIDEYLNFEGYDDEIFLGNFTEEMIESLNFNSAGCVIEMALDIRFANVFYRRSAGLKEGIDDFSFNLDGIFTSWKEYPEVIFIRTIFIDKFLSKIFMSNIMTLTKEKFKYCINETETNFRINLKDMTEFKFIDKINCTINRHDVMKEVKIAGGTGKSSIVYKTVFYRTHEAQRIKIRQGVVQNIGINLGEYMTKVENFKMKIENSEFVECGRNDVYVLFKIPGTYITRASGKYDIVNADDDTYITSGEYQLC